MTQLKEPQEKWTIAACKLEGQILALEAYLEKPYWAERDINWEYFDVVRITEYQALQSKLEKAEAENKRFKDALTVISGHVYEGNPWTVVKSESAIVAEKALKGEGE